MFIYFIFFTIIYLYIFLYFYYYLFIYYIYIYILVGWAASPPVLGPGLTARPVPGWATSLHRSWAGGRAPLPGLAAWLSLVGLATQLLPGLEASLIWAGLLGPNPFSLSGRVAGLNGPKPVAFIFRTGYQTRPDPTRRGVNYFTPRMQNGEDEQCNARFWSSMNGLPVNIVV